MVASEDQCLLTSSRGSRSWPWGRETARQLLDIGVEEVDPPAEARDRLGTRHVELPNAVPVSENPYGPAVRGCG